MQHITMPGGRPGPALLLVALLSGCGGAGSGQDQSAIPEGPLPGNASMRSAALHPVERPVARPMDRGNEADEASKVIPPIERPVAKPMDRGLAEPGQGS